jgi:hypothetical protein
MLVKVNKKLFTILLLVSFISSIVLVVGIYPSSTENNYSNNSFSNDISHEIEEKLKKLKIIQVQISINQIANQIQ